MISVEELPAGEERILSYFIHNGADSQNATSEYYKNYLTESKLRKWVCALLRL